MAPPNFNSRHLRSDDAEPFVNKDRLTVINMRFCPYATRTMLMLLKKGVDFDTLNVNLSDKPDWFLRANPLGKVPVVLQGDFVGVESAVLVDYVDDKFPEPSVGKRSPEERVRDTNLAADLDRKYVGAMYRTLRSKTDEDRTKAVADLNQGLAWLESELGRSGRGPYFAAGRSEADGPGCADYNVWPFTPQLKALEKAGITEIPWKEYPKLAKWLDLMSEDASVKQYDIPTDVWLAYFNDTKEGKIERFDRMVKG